MLGLKKLSQIGSWAFKSLLFAFLIMIAAGYFMGYRVFIINGASSLPVLKYHTLVVTYKCPIEEIQIGDYATWTFTGSGFVTHRVEAVDYVNGIITTLGYQQNGTVPNMNNDQPDYEYSYYDRIPGYKYLVGKVVANFYILGVLAMSFQSPINIITLILLVIILYVYKENYYKTNEYKNIELQK